MTTPKLIVKAGVVKSKNDGQIHYVTFHQLCKLYGISPELAKENTIGVNYHYIELLPQESGEYNLAQEISNQIDKHWIPIAKRQWERGLKEYFIRLSFWGKIKYIVKLLKQNHKGEN